MYRRNYRKFAANLIAVIVQCISLVLCSVIIVYGSGCSTQTGLTLALLLLVGLRFFRLTTLGEFLASFAAFGGMEDDEEDIIAYPSDQVLAETVLGPALQRIGERLEEREAASFDRVGFRILHKKGTNAYTIGRRTIFLTRDLLVKQPEALEDVILHEFDRLADKSTEIQEWSAAGDVLLTIAGWVPLIFTAFRFFDLARTIKGGNLFFFLVKASAFGRLLLILITSRLCLACWEAVRSRMMQRYRLECDGKYGYRLETFRD